jgi:hypothetical protein
MSAIEKDALRAATAAITRLTNEVKGLTARVGQLEAVARGAASIAPSRVLPLRPIPVAPGFPPEASKP